MKLAILAAGFSLLVGATALGQKKIAVGVVAHAVVGAT